MIGREVLILFWGFGGVDSRERFYRGGYIWVENGWFSSSLLKGKSRVVNFGW